MWSSPDRSHKEKGTSGSGRRGDARLVGVGGRVVAGVDDELECERTGRIGHDELDRPNADAAVSRHVVTPTPLLAAVAPTQFGPYLGAFDRGPRFLNLVLVHRGSADGVPNRQYEIYRWRYGRGPCVDDGYDVKDMTKWRNEGVNDLAREERRQAARRRFGLPLNEQQPAKRD